MGRQMGRVGEERQSGLAVGSGAFYPFQALLLAHSRTYTLEEVPSTLASPVYREASVPRRLAGGACLKAPGLSTHDPKRRFEL